MGVIYKPPSVHSCSPGWTWKNSTGEGLMALPAGTRYGVPPMAWEYPTGTVWLCECGTAWVSQGRMAINWELCRFRRESWFERRRRERKARS